MNAIIFTRYGLLIGTVLMLVVGRVDGQAPNNKAFSREHLVAWCIVPFDAKQRTPKDRAAMLANLGITKLAYDWRDEYIPTFDEEWEALQQHGIDLFAFWLPSNVDPANEPHIQQVFAFLERNHIKTQLWYLPGWFAGYENLVEGFSEMSRQEQIATISEPIRYVAERARKLGCSVGLYNHGGWFGEPENQIAVIQHLGLDNVGMVYNFQHGRHHLARFSEFYPKMKPYLSCINVVGLASGDEVKVVPLGTGDMEYRLLQQIVNSGYDGPMSIQNHRSDRDAEEALISERKGLHKILRALSHLPGNRGKGR
ncbi:sugar phosphate isomerase/epimerase family protein [Parapedobacter sp. GCM10030251]|uniref:sugar phosphate isomerase/epimerase family protein n=1 Tax=Parapedobacter sp. GCM10030251 TaxID=3273419 RepID=UPI00361ED7EA